MSLKYWFAFFFLVIAWGSSYFWTKIALREVNVTSVITWRIFFATAGLFVLSFVKKSSIPKGLKLWLKITFLSWISIVIPFHLLSWGVSQISSSLVGILNGTVPLFTVLLAHLFLKDEKLNRNKTIGLIFGFVGSVFLVNASNSKGLASLMDNLGDQSVLGALAILTASAFYGLGSIVAKHLTKEMTSSSSATAVTFMALATMVPIHLFHNLNGNPQFQIPQLPLTYFSLVWLGLIGSCLAYVTYYYVIRAIGASRASFVMYLSPFVALLLGTLALGEPISASLILGGALVLMGVVIANQ